MEELDYKNIDIKSLEFSLSEGEKLLKTKIETSSELTSRALVYTNSSLGLLIALLGYTVANQPSGLMLIESLVAFGFLLSVLSLSYNTYSLYKISPIGNYPFNVITNEICNYAKEDSYKYMVYQTCKNVQLSIEENAVINQSKVDKISEIEKRIKIGLIALISIAFIYWFIYQF